MTRMDLRVQAWGWLTRRQASVATMTEERLAAMQRRQVPDNFVTGWLFGAQRPGTAVTDRTVSGPDGNEIPVRIYRAVRAPGAAPGHAASGNAAGSADGVAAGDAAVPGSAAAVAAGDGSGLAARPLIMYIHGGGFVFGGLRMGDWLCSSAALRTGAVVISVDYRLAPAHRFPTAVEDCYAALTWAAGNAAELGARGPIGVMGESAGGNLSAVMCLLARDRGGPAIAHQSLCYPATDMSDAAVSSASRLANRNAPFLSAEEMTAYRRLYLGDDGDPADPKASPLLAASLAGLPPALIQVAEHDPLKDDGTRYAAALRAAGVQVRLTEYVGMPHGFLNFPGLCRGTAQALSEIVAEQSAALAAPALPPEPAEPAKPAEPAM
ncbi:MAG TPA: alpha/beta hydrolase [Trebonia sp.]